MIAPLLVLASLAYSAPEDYRSLPGEMRAEIQRVEKDARRSALFSRLLLENDGLERGRGTLPAPEFVRFERSPRRLVYDPKRMGKATEWELELAEARELARASMGLPVTLVESEAAALQKELIVALELSTTDEVFSKAWAARGKKAKAAADAAARLDEWASALAPEAQPEPLARLPAGELDRLAFYAALLAQSPSRFYDGVGALLPAWRDPCRLSEVEDFTTLHARELRSISAPPGRSFAAVGSSRYPSRVVRAAQALADAGGPAYAREAIGPREKEAEELTPRLRIQFKWPAGAAP